MRVKSELWVKAHLRICSNAGVPAVVVKRGDGDAGVIYVKVAALDGTADLFGPAPAGLVEREDRKWCRLRTGSPEADVDRFLAREVGFDPDAWIVEIEDRARRHFLDDWLAT